MDRWLHIRAGSLGGRKRLILGLLLFPFLAASAQSLALRNLDDQLTASYQAFANASLDQRNDSLGHWFLAQLKAALTDPATFDQPFDSLSQYITITSSTDKRLKFYSWDALEGGSWHTLHCLAQFRGADGTLQVQQLDQGNEGEVGSYSDSNVEQVHDLVQGEAISYLTVGWGSHGGGMEHVILRVFGLEGDRLVACKSCFQEAEGHVIEYPRGCRLDLHYDPERQEIRYAVFQRPNAAGFSKPLTALTVLQLPIDASKPDR